MRLAKHDNCCNHAAADGLEQAAARLAGFERISWKEALGGIASSAFRLHRYREVHNRLLLGALRERDCPGGGASDT